MAKKKKHTNGKNDQSKKNNHTAGINKNKAGNRKKAPGSGRPDKKLIVILALILLIALIGCILAFSGKGSSENEPEPAQSAQTQQDLSVIDQPTKIYEGDEVLSGIHHAEIEIEGYGTIELELDADTAPQTVSNFAALADSGFYDGLTFHRIINGIMMQGGDRDGTGYSRSENTITGEFAENGIPNSITHERGVISMARSKLYNSAGTQFFIVQGDSTYLDGQYAAFGHVTSGMDIVDKICEETPVVDMNGKVAEGYKPVIKKISMID